MREVVEFIIHYREIVWELSLNVPQLLINFPDNLCEVQVNPRLLIFRSQLSDDLVAKFVVIIKRIRAQQVLHSLLVKRMHQGSFYS